MSALGHSRPSHSALVRANVQYYKNEVARLSGNTAEKYKLIRVCVSPGPSTLILITGRTVNVPENRIIEVTEEEIVSILQNGGSRVD
jgi:hypothetical protein